MSKVEVSIVAVSDGPDGAYSVVLEEKDGDRKLIIQVGKYEAQNIALATEQEMPRPMTHKLAANIITATNHKVTQAYIHSLNHEVFHCSLYLEKDKNEVIIDCRPSDALTISVYLGCPVYVGSELLTSYSTGELPATTSLKDYSKQELLELLDKFVANEDYKKAALIRKELNTRQ